MIRHTASHTKKPYDLLLAVNRTISGLSIRIFVIVMAVASCYINAAYTNEFFALLQ